MAVRGGRRDWDQVPWFMRDANWSRVGLAAAIGLLTLAPLVHRRASKATFWTYIQLPIYMIHLFEEHRHGEFKREFNELAPPQLGYLSNGANFLVHVPIVWGFDAASTAVAATAYPAGGIGAPYLTLFNGLFHVAMALLTRRTNAGIWTAIGLMLPLGGYGVWAVGRETKATPLVQVGTLGLGIGGHLLLLGLMILDRRRTRG